MKNAIDSTKVILKHIAAFINNAINEDPEKPVYGFVLLTFRFHEHGVNYIANANRADTIATLREVADRLEQEDRAASAAKVN